MQMQSAGAGVIGRIFRWQKVFGPQKVFLALVFRPSGAFPRHTVEVFRAGYLFLRNMVSYASNQVVVYHWSDNCI